MQEENQSSTLSTMARRKKKAKNFLYNWKKFKKLKLQHRSSTIRRRDGGMWDKYSASLAKEVSKKRDKNVSSPSQPSLTQLL